VIIVKKGWLITAIFLLLLLVAGLTGTHAFDRSDKVTPYGDFCNHVSHYGMHRSLVDMAHAKEALQHYYGKKGLDIEIESSEGRFLKVYIKNGQEIVDKIIFDRHSGRVRSIR
jgi:hypothetical protein